MKEILLSGPKGRGLFMLVDDEDYELMSRIKWYPRKDRNGSVGVQGQISAHRFLTGYRLTDHVNGNQLDNTRANLRDATPRQNSWNRGLRTDSRTGYKGVSSRRGGRGYVARIEVDGKRKTLGWFHDPVEAAKAYDAAAREHFGEFARLNFPDGAPPAAPAKYCARPDCGKEFKSALADVIYCSRGCTEIMAMQAVQPVYPDVWSRRPKSGTLSGLKGVSWTGGRTCRWKATIMREGKRLFLGYFDNREEAGRVYDAAARKLFGEYAWLNFPDEVPPTVQGSLFDDDEIAA